MSTDAKTKVFLTPCGPISAYAIIILRLRFFHPQQLVPLSRRLVSCTGLSTSMRLFVESGPSGGGMAVILGFGINTRSLYWILDAGAFRPSIETSPN